MENSMVQRNLSSMTVDALLKLRDEIGTVLSRRADDLKTELKAIAADYADVGRIAVFGKKSLRGRKVPIKYRDKASNTWAGRGAQPLWMREAINKGAKRDDFLVSKPVRGSMKRKAARKGRPKKALKKAA
jgi:DNA-binding protein H-NS